MLGVPYEGPCRIAGGGGGLGVSGYGLGAAPSAEVAEARLIRSDTDWAYEESLRQDREARRAVASRRRASRRRRKPPRKRRRRRRRRLVAPPRRATRCFGRGGERGAPRRARCGRRRRRGHRGKTPRRQTRAPPVRQVAPAAERLQLPRLRRASGARDVPPDAQFPRRAFEDHAEGAPTLEQVGLTQKQEALFVDLL